MSISIKCVFEREIDTLVLINYCDDQFPTKAGQHIVGETMNTEKLNIIRY